MSSINKIALIRKVRLLVDEVMDRKDLAMECKFSHAFGILELGMLMAMERSGMTKRSQKNFLAEQYKRMMEG